MSVSMVTVRRGGSREAMIAATRKLKAVAEKNGATNFVLNQIVVGTTHESGQWVISIGFTDWEAFGKSMQATQNDSAANEALAALNEVSQIVSRRTVSSVDL